MCAGDHAAQRDPSTIDQQGSFGALFAAIYRGGPGGLPAAGCFDDAPFHAHIGQVQSHDLVVGIQAQPLEPVKSLALIHSSRRRRLVLAEHEQSAIRS